LATLVEGLTPNLHNNPSKDFFVFVFSFATFNLKSKNMKSLKAQGVEKN